MSNRVLSRTAGLALLGLSTLFWVSCNEHAPLRENANAQNNALAESKLDELAVAEGVYEGKVNIFSSNRSYVGVLTIKRVIEMRRADQATETVKEPMLAANLVFPELEDDYDAGENVLVEYSDLLDPMGRMLRVVVDAGDYTPSTHELALPYSVSTYTHGNYGQLTGVLEGDRYTGSWYAKPLGEVGTFEFVKKGSRE